MKYLNKIKQRFNVIKVSPNTGEVLCSCESPTCIDKKPALYANAKTGWYFCHRCHFKGRLVLDGDEDIFYPDDSVAVTKKSTTDYTIFDKALSYNSDYQPPYFVKGMYYLRNRGFTDRELQDYNIRVAGLLDGGKYKNRVLFPCYFRGRMVSFIARTFVNATPKYLISPTIDGNEYIYNYDLAAIANSKLVITEGVVDAIAVSRATGYVGVALLGKYLSDNKFSYLEKLARKTSAKRIYLFYDADVGAKITYSTAMRLSGIYGYSNTYVVKPPVGKDAGDMTIDELVAAFDSSKNMFYLAV